MKRWFIGFNCHTAKYGLVTIIFNKKKSPEYLNGDLTIRLFTSKHKNYYVHRSIEHVELNQIGLYYIKVVLNTGLRIGKELK
ncbi:MAG: hypothetical protein N3D85_01115 [Candidatus Bathyarchaeota archaeon]|nr:hypothetical protein [Candidatus Bathyarchaeota archaeon]